MVIARQSDQSTMECPVELLADGHVLRSPELLYRYLREADAPELTFAGDYSQFTLLFQPNRQLLAPQLLNATTSTSNEWLCHFAGTDGSGRDSWLSACSADGVSLVLKTSENVFVLRPVRGGFVLVPQTQQDCDLGTHQSRRRVARAPTRVAKANPDYYSEFAFALQQRRWVEFAFVADHSIYEKYTKDESKVNDRLHTLANMMNSFYKPINIEIRLVYTEVWTDEDKVEVTANSDKTLDGFLAHRKTFMRAHPNDSAHMLTNVRFENGVVGKAFKGTMCSYDYSGGVNVDHQSDASHVAATIAHEMGHNFGMDHDVDYSTCKCPARNKITHCIMAPAAGIEAPSHWSDCSLKYLETSLDRGVDLCLKNEPDKAEKAVCGNGVVEDGEDCDCGSGGCNHDCCDPSTCKLTEKAQCAEGFCCDIATCKPKERATLCRASTNECDLAEYCDGETNQCPADFAVQDGLQCPSSSDGYCYNGECGSRTNQCKKIWGPTGRAGVDSCYSSNIKGSIHGNCGYDIIHDNFTKCAPKDIFCGRLHCDKDTEVPVFGTPSQITVANSHVFNRDKNAYDSCFVIKTGYETNGKRKETTGMTLDGTTCGKDKVCLNTHCVPLQTITKTTSKCDDDCNGHGICNNVGNCHCENGYGGVSCNIPGLGGSVNSNPANFSRGTDVLIITLVFLILCILGFVAATIHWKRKGKGFLPGIVWKEVKERLKLRGILVPTRKAPAPPNRPGHSRMTKDRPTSVTNGAWGSTGIVTYTARPPPLVANVPPVTGSFASPSSSPDPLLPANHAPAPSVGFLPSLFSAVTARPAAAPPTVPDRPRDSAIVRLYSEHGKELGMRAEAPAPPVKKETSVSLNRTGSQRPEVKPPPPPHKPKPDVPAKPDVRSLASRFEKK